MSGREEPLAFSVSTQGLHYVSRDTAHGQRMLVHLERSNDLRMLTLTELMVLEALLQAASEEISRALHDVRTGRLSP